MNNFLLLTITFAFSFCGSFYSYSQDIKTGDVRTINATLDSSNLPIIRINTNGQSIPDEPKITADMFIIDHGYNAINHVLDTVYTYKGKIGIEMRGSISQSGFWPQKSYSLETRTKYGLDTNVALMGMPKEADWVLYGPYDDHALMRNVLTYTLVRQMGYWAPRTKYCELQLNTLLSYDYKGVYVMMEKIKRDNNRVDISKLDSNDNAGDSLTGGYIFAVDKNINKPDSGWTSLHPQNAGVFYTYKYPAGDDITAQQKSYIKAYVDSFENAMSSPGFENPVTGFRKYIEPVSFMDFFFIQELSKNIDAYKRSAYLYKDKNSKGGKLHAGPHWDYNSAYGIAFCGFDVDTGWTYPLTCWVNQSFQVPFWWKKLLQDTSYTHDLKCRWLYLRSTVLDTANIFRKMDSIANYISRASVRQFAQYNISSTLQADVNVLKNWIRKRLKWMDEHMPGNCWNIDVNDEPFENSFSIYPNPSSGKFNMQSVRSEVNRVDIYDTFGRNIKSLYVDERKAVVDISSYPNGVYFMKCYSDAGIFSKKVVKLE